MASDIRLHIVKNTDDLEVAHALVHFAIQPAKADVWPLHCRWGQPRKV